MAPRQGSSKKLGAYVEYAESRRHLLLVFLPWFLLGLMFLVTALFSLDSPCPHATCSDPDAADRLATTSLFGVGFMTVAGYFLWRHFVRHAGVRVGDLGFEDRTGLFRFHRVAWRQVVALDGSFVQLWWWMDARFQTSSGRRAIRLRLSGLTAPPLEVEAALHDKLNEVLRQHWSAVIDATVRPALLYPDQVLSGVLVRTYDEQFLTDLTQAALLDVLAGMTPGTFVIVSLPDVRSHLDFIQTMRNEDGSWSVEYQAGSLDQHFVAGCSDLGVLHKVIVGWVMDWPEWQTLLPWEQISLVDSQ